MMDVPALSAKPPSPVQIRAAPPNLTKKIVKNLDPSALVTSLIVPKLHQIATCSDARMAVSCCDQIRSAWRADKGMEVYRTSTSAGNGTARNAKQASAAVRAVVDRRRVTR